MTAPDLGQALLTPDAVAEHLAVTKEVVYDLVQAGKLRGIRWGSRTLRFDAADVAAFVEASRTELRQPLIRDGLALKRAKTPGSRAAVRRVS
ncbi:MAG: hypothetical protein JWP11_1324 [Frankiales bacterium]|nr:hypothetical protein [Frankiales bacterium]